MNIFTAAKLIAILIVIVGGAWKFLEGVYKFFINKIPLKNLACNAAYTKRSTVGRTET